MQINCFLCGDLRADVYDGDLLCTRCKANPKPSADMTPEQIAGWNDRWGRYQERVHARALRVNP